MENKKISDTRNDIANAKNRCGSIWMGEGSADLITKEVGEVAGRIKGRNQ